MRARRTLAVLVALVLAVGAAGVAAASTSVTFRELDADSRAAITPGEPTSDAALVLRTAAGARKRLRAWGLGTAAVRHVDFRHKSLVVLLAAYQPSGGYRARVSRIAVAGARATVTATVRHEGGDFSTADLERPWVIVAVGRHAVANARGAVRVVLR
jgi:hypothetical protein